MFFLFLKRVSANFSSIYPKFLQISLILALGGKRHDSTDLISKLPWPVVVFPRADTGVENRHEADAARLEVVHKVW